MAMAIQGCKGTKGVDDDVEQKAKVKVPRLKKGSSFLGQHQLCSYGPHADADAVGRSRLPLRLVHDKGTVGREWSKVSP
jgi:hypothetical protein